MSAPRHKSHHLLTFLIALGFWMIVCLVDATWYYFVALGKGPTPPWTDIMLWNLPYWLVIVVLTPAVVWVSRRAGFASGRRWRAIGIHAAGVLLFAIVHMSAYRILRNLIAGNPAFPPYFLLDIRKAISSVLDKEILLYLVIVIAVSAIDYYRRFREKERAAAALELEQARLKASLSEAQLDALKMQIQPHFLFNSLHAISTLIMRGDAADANQMLLHLSQFLRMTLDNTSSQEVPLAIELEFLEAYLRIQRVRFGDRLRIEMDIEEQALKASVPNLVLQPLAENAIRHGIGSDAASGTIAIRAHVAGNSLSIQVQDDGTGLQGNSTPPEGVGLRNIRARLAELYPGAHSFTLYEPPSGGTIATLTLPYRIEGAAAGVRRDSVAN
jgi:two-component sensor histidine kinase